MQQEMMAAVHEALVKKLNAVIHAPTGLGKTAASLAPALAYAREKKLTVFFLTSRHTQHHLAIKTLQDINAKHNLDLAAVDIIGKHAMCLHHTSQAVINEEAIEEEKNPYECDFLK